MARVRFQFIFAALWILKEIEAANTIKSFSMEEEVGQPLSYWKPPNVKRRSIKVHKNSLVIEPIRPVLGNQTLGRGKSLEPFVAWSSHEGSTKKTTRRDDGVKTSKKLKFNSGKDKTHVRHLRQATSKEKEDFKSTRVAPILLNQQNPEPSQKEEGNRDSFTDPFLLNAYSVEAQFTKLLSEFDTIEFTTEILGRTASYIDIVLFKIAQKGSKLFRTHESKYVENEDKDKQILFIVHALTPMGLGNLYSLTLESHLKILISYYLAHIDKFDIYLIPLANPDGYLKVKTDAYWTKNVAPNAACPGVDVDRNFDVAWNNSQDINSCSQHYPGVAPFSEPESRAVRDVLHRMSHKIIAYFHVHGATYDMNTFKGDAVLYPKGYTEHQTDDDKYIDLKGEIEEGIKNANFKVISVQVETIHNWYGKVSGTSVDYADTVYGIPYTMEFAMQLYQDAFFTHFKRMTQKRYELTSLEYHSLSEIWRRIINKIINYIHKKIEAEAAGNR